MKRLILPLLSSVVLLTLTGCEGVKYAKYNGEQRAWPTGSAFTDSVYAVPVYKGWPEKPYEVLGFVQFGGAGTDWNQGDVKQAAGEARKAGGDAMILFPKGYDPSPTTTATRDQLGISAAQTVAVVVKWK